MNPTTFAGHATRWASYLVPLGTTFAITLIAVLPLPIPYYSFAAPSLTLIAIYYWMVFRPDLMPTFGVFVLGVVADALAGAPLGVSSLVYMLAQLLVLNQRRVLVGQPFWILWCGFALLAPLARLLEWVALSLLREAPLAPLASVSGMALTVLMFPLVTYVLVRVQRALLGAPPGDWDDDA
jgi:rod shape-determining protein MreD